MFPISCRIKDRVFTLVYKTVQGPAPSPSPGSSPATCLLGDPMPTTEAHTKSTSIWGFWMRCSLPRQLLFILQSHLQCQLLREVFLFHTTFSKSAHHSVTSPRLLPYWHNVFVYCRSPLTGNINLVGAGSALGSTVTPGPHKSWALRKGLLNECLNMAPILDHSQHLSSALRIITV